MFEEITKQIEFFREQQTEFANTHHGQYVVIHRESVFGFYPTEPEAYWAALAKGLKPGRFSIHHCIHKREEKPGIFRSRVG